MSNYYEKRDAKVRIAHELMNLGWKVYGYKEDQSDSMTDYYSPADWDGIATKNGYVLVVDNKYSNMSGKEITRYNPNYVSMSSADHLKIESLKNMTTSNGATEGEAENAQKLIEKLQSKYSNQTESKWEVIGHYPTYENTTKGSIWHLEKDGALADKGNKLTIFDSMPDSREFDINTMEFTDRYKKVWVGNDENGCRIMEDRQLTEEERKAVNEFKSFILRIERIVNFGNSCGDGTKETEEAFKQQNEDEKMVKKTFEKVKKVIKPVKVERDFVKVGDYVNYKGNRATYCYWKVTDINEERKTFTYQSTGKKYQEVKNCRSYYNYLNKLNELYDIFELQEVEEVETVEKWVKVKTTKTTKKETVKTETVAETKEEVKIESTQENNNVEFEVIEDIHTKTNEKIYVAKLIERVSKDEFITILSKIKKLGGYYYKYKGGFIFSENPTELLKENFRQSYSAEETNISNDNINLESVASYIIDNSSAIIESLNISKSEYWNNSDYKEKLLKVIKDRQLTKSQFNSVIQTIEQHEECKEYKKLIEVLKGFCALEYEIKEVPQIEIDINNINAENFPISKEISKRENDGHWVMRNKEREHQQEILNYLNNYQSSFINELDKLEDNSIKNKYKLWLNSYKKRYYENYYKLLRNNADNPSWMTTGRDGRNARKDAKMSSRHDNLMRELIALESEFKSKLGDIKGKIIKEKDKKFIDAVLSNKKEYEYKRIKKQVNVSISNRNNYFQGSNLVEKTAYITTVNAQDYYILNVWGTFIAVDTNGNSFKNGSYSTLKDAKTILNYYLSEIEKSGQVAV